MGTAGIDVNVDDPLRPLRAVLHLAQALLMTECLNAVKFDGDFFIKKLVSKGKTGAGRLIHTFLCLWEDT